MNAWKRMRFSAARSCSGKEALGDRRKHLNQHPQHCDGEHAVLRPVRQAGEEPGAGFDLGKEEMDSKCGKV